MNVQAVTLSRRALGTRPPRPAVVALGCAFAVLPFSPALVLLTAIEPPGVAVVPRALAEAMLVVLVLLGAAAFATTRRLDATEAGAGASIAGPVAAYAGSWAVAAAFGVDPLTGVWYVVAMALSCALHVAIARTYASGATAVTIFGAFLASGLSVSLIGLAMVATRTPSAAYVVAHGRAVGTFLVPGEFAGYLLFLVPVAFGVALCARAPWLRALAVAGAASGLVALWATYSRAGWYGISVAAALLIFVRYRKVAVAFGLIVALGLEALWLLGFNGHHNPSEEYSRIPIWIASLRAFTLFPLTGVGPGGFRDVFASLHPPGELAVAFHPHGYVLEACVETGTCGLAALAYLWTSFARSFAARLRDATPAARTLGLAFGAAFVATWVQAGVDCIHVLELGAWIPFMALALEATRHGLRDA
jgi:O-antigen ligase